ncbi:MAG: DUF2723 domain-containing protein [candidate division WOR-3 bacterium]
MINYLTTLSPSVGPMDSGELTLTAMRLGVAHPPGYPLFTWLGRIATMFGGEPALAANLMTAIIAAAAVGTLFLAAVSLNINHLGAAVASLSLAFSATFWQQATAHEVYTLAALLLSLLILSVAQARRGSAISVVMAGYLFGLALAHQPTALLWLPALLVLYFTGRTPARPRWVLPALPAAVILGASSALGTLFLARSRPLFNWGDPSTLERFWAHVTASQYRPLTLTSLFWIRLSHLPQTIISEFGLPVLLLILVGAGWLFHTNRSLLASVAVLLLAGTFALGYQIVDYRVQLLPQFLALALTAGASVNLLDALAVRLKQIRRTVSVLASILPLAAPGYALFTNFPAAREMRLPIVPELGENLLNSLPDSAVLLTSDDCTRNSVTYLQYVRAQRRDVRTVHADMLFSPAYRKELNSWLHLPAPAIPPAVTGHEQQKQVLLAQLVDAIPSGRPVFVTTDMLDPEFLTGPVMRRWRPVPFGIVVRLVPAAATLNLDSVLMINRELWSSYRQTGVFNRLHNSVLADIARIYPSALNNLAAFFREQGKYEAALASLHQALTYPVPDWLERLIERQLELIPVTSPAGETAHNYL